MSLTLYNRCHVVLCTDYQTFLKTTTEVLSYPKDRQIRAAVQFRAIPPMLPDCRDTCSLPALGPVTWRSSQRACVHLSLRFVCDQVFPAAAYQTNRLAHHRSEFFKLGAQGVVGDSMRRRLCADQAKKGFIPTFRMYIAAHHMLSSSLAHLAVCAGSHQEG